MDFDTFRIDPEHRGQTFVVVAENDVGVGMLENEDDDDPARLFDYDAVIDIFSNRAPVEGEGYLTVDVARFGKDTMENFFKDAVAMSEPVQVIEEPERNPVMGCPSKNVPKHSSKHADYTPKHKEGS